MCGIVGVWLKNESNVVKKQQLERGIAALNHRGPDASKIKIDANVGLAHARLSILDLSEKAHQPMADDSGRYSLIFNGEIYNGEDLKKNLPKGLKFNTSSDTEILLQHLIQFGEKGLKDLNGFFAFLFYDHHTKTMLFARDRYGIKPLLMYEDGDKLIFSSEIAPFLAFDIDKTVSNEALNLLFQLTYIPAPHTIFESVQAIQPGYFGIVVNGKVSIAPFYDLTDVKPIEEMSYEAALIEVKSKIEKAVERRMVADVPLGTFLSGGVDSSIISLVAKKFKRDLKTFSIGFDVPYFDESEFAVEMAESIQSNHHQIQLNQADFKAKFNEFLALNHQPFADSSAFAVYLLSQKTKEHVTVCLSGDGADELFGGYRKHEAAYKIQQLSLVKKRGIKLLALLSKKLPQGRHGKWPELNRKVQKLAVGLNLTEEQRYWQWLCFISEAEKNKLLKKPTNSQPELSVSGNLNSVLQADQLFVLPNDMLTKVDRLSMANGLEVRTPFLDHELVDFVNSLPASFKVNKNGRKQLLIDAFKEQLPERIYNRPKKGFEIPLFDWLQTEIQTVLASNIFSESFIVEQGIFNYDYIHALKTEFKRKSFGDKIYLVWTLIVFQTWWHNNLWKQIKQ